MKTAKIWSILILTLGLMLWPAQTTKGDAEWSSAPGRIWNTTLTNRVGIGTSAPTEMLHIVGGNLVAEREGDTNVTFLGRVCSNNYYAPAVYFYRGRGTLAAPAALLAGDPLGYFGFGGHNGSSWASGRAFFQARADGNWSSSSTPTHMLFATCASGSTSGLTRMLIDSTGNIGIGTGTADPIQRLQVSGNSLVSGNMSFGPVSGSEGRGVVHHGTTGIGGQASTWQPNGTYNGVWLENRYGEGGGFYADGDVACIWSPGDPDILRVYDEDVLGATPGAPGFVISGGGSTGFEVGINTASPTAPLHVYDPSPGDSSVILPVNSINNAEILNEAGCATYNTSTTTALSKTAYTVIGSRTISCPTAGYVLVIGTTGVWPYHVTGTSSLEAVFGVSASSTTLPSSQYLTIWVDNDLPTGYYDRPTTAHAVFPVAAGARTFYFLARQTSGHTDSYVNAKERQLSCIFLPTAYGTVSTPMPAPEGAPQLDREAEAVGEPGLTAEDILAEQVEAEEIGAGRVQAEIEKMRAEIEALRAEMDQLKEEKAEETFEEE